MKCSSCGSENTQLVKTTRGKKDSSLNWVLFIVGLVLIFLGAMGIGWAHGSISSYIFGAIMLVGGFAIALYQRKIEDWQCQDCGGETLRKLPLRSLYIVALPLVVLGILEIWYGIASGSDATTGGAFNPIEPTILVVCGLAIALYAAFEAQKSRNNS